MPLRRCVACRRVEAKTSLVRLVVSGGAVVVDPPARASGRGAYLCGRPTCTDRALARGGAALRRALRVDGGRTTVDAGPLRAAVTAAAGDEHHDRPQSGARDTAWRREE